MFSLLWIQKFICVSLLVVSLRSLIYIVICSTPNKKHLKTDFIGMRTTGKSFRFEDVDIFKFKEEGKIAENRTVHLRTI
ncbi:MAG: ester cyclase [Chitinophagaceae bacterium]